MGANNQYEKALYQVGAVVEPYDHDKMFPVFGFGGIPRHNGDKTNMKSKLNFLFLPSTRNIHTNLILV